MINVLFLSAGDQPDYMCDMVYHGLKTHEGILVEELNTPHYMYRYYKEKDKLYGKGFTIFGRLDVPPNCISVESMKSKVLGRYYDYVVYGSIKRYYTFFDFVSATYPIERLLAVDGEDKNKIIKTYAGRCIYYKRELKSQSATLRPINFSIPEELIVNTVPQKSKKVAHIIPGALGTYIFDREDRYFEDYQVSIFGITRKKAGWDCLRHYEILMNGCIPYFIDLHKCPPQTMTRFPKEIIKITNRFYETGQDFDYSKFISELLAHTRDHLTTRKLVEYLLPGLNR